MEPRLASSRATRAHTRLAFCLSLALGYSLTPSVAGSVPLSITPPPSLTLDGLPIVSGTFTLTGATAFSDPGAVITETILLDQGDGGDDVAIAATIGGTSPHFLVDVPLATEVLRLEGFFSATTPFVPDAVFDIIVGVTQDVSTDAFTYFLPQVTSTFFYQTTDLGLDPTSTLDNSNFFSTGAEPVIALSPSDPSLFGRRLVTLDNGVSNPWFVGLDDSLMIPFSIAQIVAGGGGGCSMQISGPASHGRSTPPPLENECDEAPMERNDLPIVPEPSSLLLVGAGLLTLTGARGRSHRRQQ